MTCKRFAIRNREKRKKEWPRAEKIITEETARFMQDLITVRPDPVVRRLRDQAEELKREELDRLIAKLQQSGVDPEITKEIEKSFDRLVNKLLHPPLASLRDDAAEGHSRGVLDAIRHMFNLGDE